VQFTPGNSNLTAVRKRTESHMHENEFSKVCKGLIFQFKEKRPGSETDVRLQLCPMWDEAESLALQKGCALCNKAPAGLADACSAKWCTKHRIFLYWISIVWPGTPLYRAALGRAKQQIEEIGKMFKNHLKHNTHHSATWLVNLLAKQNCSVLGKFLCAAAKWSQSSILTKTAMCNAS